MPTHIARLACDEATARRIADQLAESFEAVAAFEGTDGRWTVEVHFEHAADQENIRRAIGTAAGADVAAGVTFDTVAARDWIAASLAGLKPVAAGRFLVHGAHDRAKVSANRLGIEIEAALAFGTGHHGTTRGCLLALDRLLKTRRRRTRVLDVGTGTGVLAIAAAKATRARVLASDIDIDAVRIAAENARLNGVAPWIAPLRAAGLGDRRFQQRAPFDLIFANILLAPLKRLARPLSQLIARDGRVVLSGLLTVQENAALAAYRPHGLRLERRIPLDEWVTLVLRR